MATTALRRTLAALFCVALGVALVGAAGLAASYRGDRRLLLDLRTAWFSELVADPGIFEDTSGDLSRFGFRSDDAAARARWRERLTTDLDYLEPGWSEVGGDAVTRARALVRRFSRGGGTVCGAPSLIANARRLPRDGGQGCCSDHSEVFLALAAASGLTAREVGHSTHVFVELYAPELGKWVFLDAQYALMAREPGGALLSLPELRDRRLRGDPVRWVFFGVDQPDAPVEKAEPGLRFYDGTDDFADMTVVLGNDVFAQAEFETRLAGLPLPLRQLVGFAVGVLPRYAIYDDAHARRPERLRRLRRVSGLALLVIVLGGSAYPLLVLGGGLRGR